MRANRLLRSALWLCEHNNDKITPASLAAATAASRFGDVTALVAGKSHSSVVEEAATISGVKAVISVDADTYDHGQPENTALLLQKVQEAKSFTHVVAAHTAYGKSVVPRTAALADCQSIVDVIDIRDENTFVRPTYAGNALSVVRSTKDPVKFITVRPTSFDKAGGGGSGGVEQFESAAETGHSKWEADLVQESDKPELTAARVVVSGGRGLKNGENFKLLDELAEKLGNCAVGATRAVVDAGYVPNEMQVGQTGKVVAPDLYIAVGLSGAIQHLAGMKDSKVIACINTDPEAAIFSVADYGLVEDLFQAVPKLTGLVGK